MEIGMRLSILLKRKGVSVYRASAETGISKSSFSRIISKNSKPSVSTATKIAAYFDTNKEWLLTGEGQINQKKDNEKKTNIIKYTNEIIALKLKTQIQSDIIDGLKFKINVLENKEKIKIKQNENIKKNNDNKRK